MITVGVTETTQIHLIGFCQNLGNPLYRNNRSLVSQFQGYEVDPEAVRTEEKLVPCLESGILFQ